MPKQYFPPEATQAVEHLAQNYSDADISEMFARHWDSLAEQAVTAKNNAKNPADAQAWQEAFRRRNQRALFWHGVNSMTKGRK